jgi:hypothetical protein
MKVLVIPEDPTLDQHILKPIVQHLFKDLGRAVRVDVLQDPHLKGVDEALNSATVEAIIGENPMIDLFIIMVDRDCDRQGNVAKAAQRRSEHPAVLRTCLAEEEVEVWMLALHRDLLDETWGVIRQHCDPKEAYAEPFLKKQGWWSEVGKGRKRAMRDVDARWSGLLTVCPELRVLRDEIEQWLNTNAQ